jgi:hypothetical protein
MANFLPYSPEPNDYCDKIEPSTDVGMYVTAGDFIPDSSTDFEGGLIPDPENDAKVFFSVTTDYENPFAFLSIADEPEKIRTNADLNFRGSVTGGTPDYSWSWNFGDGTTSNLQNPTHQYTDPGSYTITFTITDGFQQTNTATKEILVHENHKPFPLTIDGPSNGKKEEKYDYTFSALDPDNDNVYYQIDWGDNDKTEWFGPFVPGTEITKDHIWDEKGSYTITFYAKDEYGAISEKQITVSMPKEKSIMESFIDKLPIRLQEIIFYFLSLF